MSVDSPEEAKDRRGCPPGQAVVVLPNGSRIGNPPHVPTDEIRNIVKLYAKVTTQQIIADQLGISVDTLQRHYRKEINAARFEMIGAVGSKIIQKALAGDVQAGKALMVQFAGWKSDRHQVEHTGEGGGPIRTIDLTPFLQGKTDDELAILEDFLVNITPTDGGDRLADESGVPPASP